MCKSFLVLFFKKELLAYPQPFSMCKTAKALDRHFRSGNKSAQAA